MNCIDCRRASTLLDVSRELPMDGVKEAHRDLVKVWHPDRFGTDTRLRIKAEQRLQEINAAFDHIRVCTWWPDSSAGTKHSSHEDTTPSETPYEPHNVRARSDKHTEGKGLARILLLSVWRTFKVMLVAAVASLLVCIVIFSIVFELAEYFKHEEDIHRHPYRSYPGRALFDAVANWSGLGVTATRGLIFLISPIVAVCAFALIWAGNLVDQHRLLVMLSIITFSAFVFLWCLVMERQNESSEPTTAKEVGGLCVLLLCFAGLAFGWQDIRAFINTVNGSSQAMSKPLATTPSPMEQNKSVVPTAPTVVESNIKEEKPQVPTADVAQDLTATENPVNAGETETNGEGTRDSRASVDEAVENWRLALLSNIPRRQAAAYADVVERYFLASDWTNAQVASYLDKLHAEGGFSNFVIRDLVIDSETSSSVELHFTKDFSLERKGVVTAAVCRSVLHLVRQDGEWKINYERDFKS